MKNFSRGILNRKSEKWNEQKKTRKIPNRMCEWEGCESSVGIESKKKEKQNNGWMARQRGIQWDMQHYEIHPHLSYV